MTMQTNPSAHTSVQTTNIQTTNREATTEPWWKGAVIYQVYPRSYLDTNSDGIGDIPGIINKLDYIASLSVDAIWISPFFKSPMKDFGYDVSDFRAVDPLFGSLEDFDLLIEKAHALGLKVIIDQVLSHTSDEHAWFKESRSSTTNAKADWYVWADAKPDGSPPNNWLSVFGGSAWQWDEHRQQYYLHNFLTSQPDLNFHCDAMRQQLLQEVEFWLKRGVDGFRLDAINFCFHDAQLRDNPIKPLSERKGRGFSSDNPYAAQYHRYDNTQPENLLFLEDFRALLDRYPNRMSVGEINSDDSLATTAEYTAGDKRLHMGYSFELLSEEYSANYLQTTVSRLDDQLHNGWPCWALSNHDVIRVVTRWGKNRNREAFAKMAIALLGALRGTLCLYQGEELGLPEATIERHQLKDPFGIQFWPAFKGRDGCRTPMPWHHTFANGGFSDVSPWLPLAKEHSELTVDIQNSQQASVLNFTRHFLSWRQRQPELLYGDITFLPGPEHTLIIQRQYKSHTLTAYFNLGDKPVGITTTNSAPPISGCSSPDIVENVKGEIQVPVNGYCFIKS